jgi:4-hydroxyphenylacetate decarboxylase small subunit
MSDVKAAINVLQHCDCQNFCSIDVAKGLCRRTGERVLVDGAACDCYVQLPKCKFCAHYAPGEQAGLGICGAEPDLPWAYPEMMAVTCALFKPA